MKTILLQLIPGFLVIGFAIFQVGKSVGQSKGFNQGIEIQQSITKHRVFALFGEGDYGCELNHYLETGDTTVFGTALMKDI